jgi:hypothetical protein
VVLVVCLSRAENDGSGGSTVSRAAAAKNRDGERRQSNLVRIWCRGKFEKHRGL